MTQIKVKKKRRKSKKLTRLGTSFPERAIYHYLKNIFPDTISGYKFQGQSEIDVYIPSLSLGIEYDGFRYHRRKYKIVIDNRKNVRTANIGINLIRVREKGLPELDMKCAMMIERESNTSLNDLKECILLISDYIYKNYEIPLHMIKEMNKLPYINLKKDKPDIISIAVTERRLELYGI